MSTDLLERYRDALHTWVPESRSPAGGVSIRLGGAALAEIEQEILAAAEPRDPSTGIDPIIIMAMNLSTHWIGAQGIARRREQLIAESDEATATWTIERSKFAYQRTTAVAAARQELLYKLAAIEKVTGEAFIALDELDKMLDLSLISPRRHGEGEKYGLIEQALYQVRLGVAAARQFAPDPKTPEDALDHLED